MSAKLTDQTNRTKLQIQQYTEHAIKFKQGACSRRSEDHRPRPRRRHRPRCRSLRRWRHCRCLHLTCCGWSSQLRLLLILPLLHHHTRMTTGLARGFPKPQRRFCNPGPIPPLRGPKTESCRASYRNWIENLGTGTGSRASPESQNSRISGKQ
jgi:hypothetical protein